MQLGTASPIGAIRDTVANCEKSALLLLLLLPVDSMGRAAERSPLLERYLALDDAHTVPYLQDSLVFHLKSLALAFRVGCFSLAFGLSASIRQTTPTR
eukprot:m.188515 g.188515  ORF g.188515 m.188515 type:complete len:98 (+) comp10557_c0_seq33:791-1084(+)